VIFHLANKVVVNLQEHAILEFAVLGIASLDLDLAVKCPDWLDLGGDQVPFDKIFTDVEPVFFHATPLDATWEVDGRQVEDRVLVGVDVDKPPWLVDRDDAPDNYIADVRPIMASDRLDTNNLVDVMDDSGHRRVDILGVRLDEGSMSCDETLAEEVAWHDNF